MEFTWHLQHVTKSKWCLQSHYLATAVVQLLISWSLPSNGYKYHNVFTDDFSILDYIMLNRKVAKSKYLSRWNINKSIDFSDDINRSVSFT
jgi:hypothetical protein